MNRFNNFVELISDISSIVQCNKNALSNMKIMLVKETAIIFHLSRTNNLNGSNSKKKRKFDICFSSDNDIDTFALMRILYDDLLSRGHIIRFGELIPQKYFTIIVYKNNNVNKVDFSIRVHLNIISEIDDKFEDVNNFYVEKKEVLLDHYTKRLDIFGEDESSVSYKLYQKNVTNTKEILDDLKLTYISSL